MVASEVTTIRFAGDARAGYYDDQQGKGKKGKKQQSSMKNLLTTTVLFAVRQADGQGQQFIDFLSVAMKVSPIWVNNVDSASMQQDVPAVSIYAYDCLDEQQHRQFSSLWSAHVAGIEVSVMSNGSAKLLANEVSITPEGIESLYNPADLPMVIAAMDTIARPVLTYDLHERVNFLDDFEEKRQQSQSQSKSTMQPIHGKAPLSASASRFASASEANKKATANSEENNKTRKPLFADLAIGMRLFNAYCVGQRDK
jgi:hypothetical protein